jgi:hypothetical protein
MHYIPLQFVLFYSEWKARSGLESREYGRRDPSRWPRGTLYAQKLALTSLDKQQSLGPYSSLTDSDNGV